MAADDAGIEGTFTTAEGDAVTVTVPDGDTFEAMRDALGDPLWLLGATWQILTTNDYKRGRFLDAFGAWAERQTTDVVVDTLAPSGVGVSRA